MGEIDIKKLRKALGISQRAAADDAGIAQSLISMVENGQYGLSVAAATKAAPVVGVDAGVLYGATQVKAIMRALEEKEINHATAADRLLVILRRIIEHFEDVEDAEGGTEMLDLLEDAIRATTSVATKKLRGSGSVPAAFTKQFDTAGTQTVAAESFVIEDGRDLYGRKVPTYDDWGDLKNTAALEDPLESEFENVDSFGRNPNQVDAEDDIDGEDDGRDLFGRRIKPLK